MALPTISGGIFDFTEGGYLAPTWSGSTYEFGTANFFDLGATISGFDPNPTMSGTYSLSAYLKSTVQAAQNISAYTKAFFPGTKNISAFLKPQHEKDLPAEIFGYGPIDLNAILNVIEVENLPAYLNGILHKGSKDLMSDVFGYPPADLGAYLIAESIKDLGANLKAIFKASLPAALTALQPDSIDLGAFLKTWPQVDLPAFLHGWDTKDLGSSLTGGYGPTDIQASINATGGFKDVIAYVKGMIATEVPVDLQAIVSGYFATNLQAILNVNQAINLQAVINATGKSANLPATIIPKVIYISKVLEIALLEHKNLRAMINASCFGTGHKNLDAYIRSIEKLDLGAIIYGEFAGLVDGIKDLAMYINTEDYTVEDNLEINFFGEDTNKFTQMNISFTSTGEIYKTFDTFDILFGLKNVFNLGASLTGVLTSSDLGATLTPIWDWNYTELPHYVNPKTHEVVIKFDEKWREKWRRFVEIFFDFTGDDPYHYFYVSGSNETYRVDRTRHWTIWFKSYDEIEGSMIERRNFRQKFLFNMSNYDTVDEAVRDFVDRVSVYRERNLPAFIYGELPVHSNLAASITPDVKYSWVKHLKSSITGVLPHYDLGASITVV